jgi:hypothetical protein
MPTRRSDLLRTAVQAKCRGEERPRSEQIVKGHVEESENRPALSVDRIFPNNNRQHGRGFPSTVILRNKDNSVTRKLLDAEIRCSAGWSPVANVAAMLRR